MPVKAETSSPSPNSSSDPFTPPKQKRKADTEFSAISSSEKESPSGKSTSKKPKSSSATGTMTPAIKEALIDHMMRIACSAVKKEELALELGISKKQLDNAICSGRVNLRSMLVKAAREL